MTVPAEQIRTQADKIAVEQGYWFDADAVTKIETFVRQYCTLQDGRRVGQSVEFLPWVVRDIVAPLYGWKRPDNTRRYRRGSCWTPRKQSKTTTLACLALWQLLEEPGAQVYVVSSTFETAGHLYKMAADMVEANPVLSKRLWVRRHIKVIEDKRRHSLLKVLSGDKVGKSGHNASAVFWDELAEIKDPEAWYRLYDAGMAREQPVWFSISTPQYDRHSLAWEQYKKAVAVRDGIDTDLEYLAVVHGVPLEVDWRQPDNWWQYIPSLGETVTKEYYLNEWARVQHNPRELCRFRNLLLAQWTENLEQWLPPDKWDACIQDFDESELYGQSCYVGIDGAINQLAAYVLFFPESNTIIPRFFHPRETAAISDVKQNTTYKAWAESGHIVLTPGDLFDWPAMAESLKRDANKFHFIEVGFDPYSLESRILEIEYDLGCKIVAVPPQRSVVAGPTKHLERLVCERALRIQNNPVLTWNARNAAVKEDAHERIALDRDKAGGRYDGIAALVLALQRYLENGEEDCVYNWRGVLQI